MSSTHHVTIFKQSDVLRLAISLPAKAPLNISKFQRSGEGAYPPALENSLPLLRQALDFRDQVKAAHMPSLARPKVRETHVLHDSSFHKLFLYPLTDPFQSVCDHLLPYVYLKQK